VTPLLPSRCILRTAQAVAVTISVVALFVSCHSTTGISVLCGIDEAEVGRSTRFSASLSFRSDTTRRVNHVMQIDSVSKRSADVHGLLSTICDLSCDGEYLGIYTPTRWMNIRRRRKSSGSVYVYTSSTGSDRNFMIEIESEYVRIVAGARVPPRFLGLIRPSEHRSSIFRYASASYFRTPRVYPNVLSSLESMFEGDSSDSTATIFLSMWKEALPAPEDTALVRQKIAYWESRLAKAEQR